MRHSAERADAADGQRSGAASALTEEDGAVANRATFAGAYPIGETDVQALPVKELGPAIGYYTQVLGFAVTDKSEHTATLRRDAAAIGLAVNGGDPEQASCYFAVSDVAALREELAAKGIEPSPLRPEQHDGRQLVIFFAKEPYGVCFCFGQPANPSSTPSGGA
jgi:lactoylglutathione lyase